MKCSNRQKPLIVTLSCILRFFNSVLMTQRWSLRATTVKCKTAWVWPGHESSGHVSIYTQWLLLQKRQSNISQCPRWETFMFDVWSETNTQSKITSVWIIFLNQIFHAIFKVAAAKPTTLPVFTIHRQKVVVNLSLVCSRRPHPSSSWSWLVTARGQPAQLQLTLIKKKKSEGEIRWMKGG
jgi:hypothetical protein